MAAVRLDPAALAAGKDVDVERVQHSQKALHVDGITAERIPVADQQHIKAVLFSILQNLLDGGAHEQRHRLVCLGNALFLHAPLQFAGGALAGEALSAHTGKILRVGLVKALCNHGVFLLNGAVCGRLLCAAPPHGGAHAIGTGSAEPSRCRPAAAELLPNQRFSSSSSSFLPPRTMSPDGT